MVEAARRLFAALRPADRGPLRELATIGWITRLVRDLADVHDAGRLYYGGAAGADSIEVALWWLHHRVERHGWNVYRVTSYVAQLRAERLGQVSP